MTNFWKALELVDNTPPVKQEYRLYYEPETGEPRFYTMDEEEGEYIVVTKEQFAAARYDVYVKDGEIKRKRANSIGKLVPTKEGYGTLKKDISIVGDEQYWSVKTYE